MPRRPAAGAGTIERLRGLLATTGPLTRAELLACAALLTLIAAVAFGSHVLHGGFLMDDWSNAAKTRYLASCCGTGTTGQGIGYGAQYATLLHDGPAGYHLGLPVVIPPVFFLFGIHMGLHLALAAMLGMAMSLAGYALMRMVGLAPVHAGAIAALVLLFPWSDSTRLWSMAGYNQIAVVLVAGGILVALRGLRARGRRAVALHAVALVLYALGTLMYELAGGLVAVAALFYLARGTWRQAAVRWLPDLAVALLSLQYVKDHTLFRPVLPFDLAADHARLILDQGLTLLTRTAIPFGAPARNLVLAAIAAALVAGAVTWWRLAGADPLRARLRLWLAVSPGGAAVAVGGWVTLVPATYGAPLTSPGIENRINMISAFGLVAIAYASAAVLGLLAARRFGRPALAPALPLALAALMAVGFAVKLDRSKDHYDAAYRQGQAVLGAIGKSVGSHPPRNATFFTFGFASFTAPGVPVFAWIWDMPGAVKITFDDPTVAGFPILPGTTWQCGEKSMYPVSSYGTGPGETGVYGRSWFVDAATGASRRIDSQADCQGASGQFRPGPVKSGSDCVLDGGGPATRLGFKCGARPEG